VAFGRDVVFCTETIRDTYPYLVVYVKMLYLFSPRLVAQTKLII